MSNSNNNKLNIPQAREAMDRFKMQAAQDVRVNLTSGYNGHLTSREAGSVGGRMVKKCVPMQYIKSCWSFCPDRPMIISFLFCPNY